MAHLISTSYWALLHFLTHDSSITKMMIKRKRKSKNFVKLEVLQIAGTVETASEIQVINNDEGPVANKSRLGKFLGKSMVLV